MSENKPYMSPESMAEKKAEEDKKRQQVDETIGRWTIGLATAIQASIDDLKIPPSKGATLIVATTLMRIACRLVKKNGIETAKFMGAFEAIMQKEFAPADAQPEDVPQVTPHGTPDGRPLIVLG
jgi:hypothetical protein